MSCPTCQHTMTNLGVPEKRVFWCPRCGTVKSCTAGGEVADRPALVGDVLMSCVLGKDTPSSVIYTIAKSVGLGGLDLGDSEPEPEVVL